VVLGSPADAEKRVFPPDPRRVGSVLALGDRRCETGEGGETVGFEGELPLGVGFDQVVPFLVGGERLLVAGRGEEQVDGFVVAFLVVAAEVVVLALVEGEFLAGKDDSAVVEFEEAAG
jgi:hypothetical protein